MFEIDNIRAERDSLLEVFEIPENVYESFNKILEELDKLAPFYDMHSQFHTVRVGLTFMLQDTIVKEYFNEKNTDNS